MVSKQEAEEARHDPTVEACPRCGMPRDEWPDDSAGGALRDGVIYCCKGCADDTGCTCRGNRTQEPAGRAATKDQIRDDPASGAFLEAHRKETKSVKPEDYGTDVTSGARGPDYSHD